MDPKFRQRAHREWFLDGFGFLRIAQCDVANVKHAAEECNGHTKEYMKFRGKLGKKRASDEIDLTNRKLWHYRSNINCIGG